MAVPSASSTAEYFEKTAMPGPMIACDRSTGVTGDRSSPEPLVISSRASGNTLFSSRMKARRDIVGAPTGRGRQTSTILEARALVFTLTPVGLSVRIGQVPVTARPEL